MKTIKILSLAAILIATSLPLRSDPPTFSQHDMCCWLASWVQFVYNLKPLTTAFINMDEKVFSDYETFKKTDMGKKLANEKTFTIQRNPETNENEVVKISALEPCKKFFTQKAIGITKVYQQLFEAINKKKDTIDKELTKLHKLIQGEAFGTMSCISTATGSVDSLVTHPQFGDIITDRMVATSRDVSIIDAIKLYDKPWNKTSITPLIIFTHDDTKIQFTLDLTPIVSEEVKKGSIPLTYDLIGIILHLPSHYIAFIKDQYDPQQHWWRCDTMSGNKIVTEKEINKECLKNNNKVSFTAYRTQKE